MSVVRSRKIAFAMALAATVSLGCATSPVEPEPPVDPELGLVGSLLGTTTTVLKTTLSAVTGLVGCLPLDPVKGSKQIGSAGGTIRVGEYSLVVPSGALAKNYHITMEQVKDSVNSVRFGPEGLKFSKPARLTMSYDNCILKNNKPRRIVYVNEALKVLETPVSRDDQKREEVTADIDHFSRYAVAW